MDSQAFQLLLNKLQNQDMKLNSLDEKVDKILQWKWKLVGGTLVVSGFLTLMIQLVSIYVRSSK